MNDKKYPFNLHWIGKEANICKYCGIHLMSPYATSDCPSLPKKKVKK